MLFVNLLLVEVVLGVVVEIVVLVSGLVIVTGFVVVVRWTIIVSFASFLGVNDEVLKLEVVFGNFWPNLSLMVVPFDVVLPELLNGTLVVLGLVDVLEVVLEADDDDEVVLVFWPNGINLEVLVVPCTTFVKSSSAKMSLVSIGEVSETLVVFVLAPKGIPTELAIARGGLIFYFNKIKFMVFRIYFTHQQLEFLF